MRRELTNLQIDLESLEELDTDLMKIAMYSKKFINLSMPRKSLMEEIFHLMEAKTCLETSITILKSMIESNENKLIEKVNTRYYSYDILEQYFDNFMSILDAEMKDLNSLISRYRNTIAKEPDLTVNIKSFREKLVNYMTNLIILPLINATIIYKKLDKTNCEDPKERFQYILFREVYISAKIKGSQMRQKVSVATQASNATFQTTNITKIPRVNAGRNKTEVTSDYTPLNFEDLDEIFKDDENN